MNKQLATLLLALGAISGFAQADILFRCPELSSRLQGQLTHYLQTLHIPSRFYSQTADPQSGTVRLALNTPPGDTNTLDLFMRPEYAIRTERVSLPGHLGKLRHLRTVSKKEIMLGMLQHGRVTTFQEKACSVHALQDRVGVRQNIVAWAEHLEWDWPNGGAARWNEHYWHRGTPKPGVSLHQAVMDVFLHQEKYAMGCYTATKLVIVQGMLDYYHRIKHDPVRTRKVELALLADGDPLVGIEPGKMWSFEKDYDAQEQSQPGKLLRLYAHVAHNNFIPGDWGYLVNTDPATEEKTGYEGSNAIYLGRNQFDDYYNDNNHSYTYEQKLDEVYQWRNGVFSRSRDAAKIQPITPELQAQLSKPPEQGGLELDIRAVPKQF